MRLICMRHGQTPWNLEHRIQGHTDIPLDERGHAQAEAVAERLKVLDIEAVYASPLQRAYDTGAHIAAANHCPLIREEALIERYFGTWEGRRMEDVAREEPEAWKTWIEAPELCPIPQSESMQSVMERTVRLSERLMEKHGDDTIVLVTHANPLRMLLTHYTGLPIRCMYKVRTDNCSYTEFSMHKGQMVLATFNETIFLQERGLL